MQREHYRFYIQIRSELGIDYQTIFNELKSVRPSDAPSLRTVFNWVKHFKHGNKQLIDKPRPGRPITQTTTELVGKVRAVIDIDPWCSYDQIEAQTSLSR